MRRTALGVLLAAVALSACGNDKEPEAAPTSSPPTASVSPTASPTPTASSTCPSYPPMPDGATVVTAIVLGGKVTTAHPTWSVKLGTKVRIVVVADVADEVHVHSYDKKVDTTKNCPTAIDLTANIPGSVEVELEDAGLHLFDLKAS